MNRGVETKYGHVHVICLGCAPRQIGVTGPEERCCNCKMVSRETCKESKPLLAEDSREAQRLAYSGRSWPALKESKHFDAERLAESPLFAQNARLF
jgi:hypothetical protein